MCARRTFEGEDIDAETFDHRMGIFCTNKSWEYARLIQERERSEECYRRAKALEKLTVLRNTKVRQPLVDYQVGHWVWCWRRQVQDPEAPTVFKQSLQCGWVGLGRILLSERLPRFGRPRAAPDVPEDRSLIYWMLVGSRVYMCSVYSLQMTTDDERVMSEFHRPPGAPAPTTEEMMPNKKFIDVSGELAADECEEHGDLPDESPVDGLLRSTKFVVPPTVLARMRQNTSEDPMPASSSGGSAPPAASAEYRAPVPDSASTGLPPRTDLAVQSEPAAPDTSFLPERSGAYDKETFKARREKFEMSKRELAAHRKSEAAWEKYVLREEREMNKRDKEDRRSEKQNTKAMQLEDEKSKGALQTPSAPQEPETPEAAEDLPEIPVETEEAVGSEPANKSARFTDENRMDTDLPEAPAQLPSEFQLDGEVADVAPDLTMPPPTFKEA